MASNLLRMASSQNFNLPMIGSAASTTPLPKRGPAGGSVGMSSAAVTSVSLVEGVECGVECGVFADVLREADDRGGEEVDLLILAGHLFFEADDP